MKALIRSKGAPMRRILLPYIFNLANQLEPLANLPTTDTPYSDVFIPLWVAQNSVEGLANSSVFSPYLRTSFALSQQLLNALKTQTGQTDMNRSVTQYELWNIKNIYTQYKTALLAELGALDSYFVTRKDPFDTLTLLEFGERLFPNEMAQKAPEAVFDCREAGKCLAYEVPTACGFHIFRVTEAVLKRYWDHVAGGSTRPKLETIGNYAAEMEKNNFGDQKIVESLKQMAKLHRNPLIHPEVILTIDEAVETLGIARSVVGAMLRSLPDVPPTTSTAPQPAPP